MAGGEIYEKFRDEKWRDLLGSLSGFRVGHTLEEWGTHTFVVRKGGIVGFFEATDS
jgi:hypothetical protein